MNDPARAALLSLVLGLGCASTRVATPAPAGPPYSQCARLVDSLKHHEIDPHELDLFEPDLDGLAAATARARGAEAQACDAAYEAALRDAAVRHDREARRQRSRKLALRAERYYARYVAAFPDRPEAYAVHFYYGELLNSLERARGAVAQYRKVVEMDPRGTYSEDAASALINELSLTTMDCGAFEARLPGPTPFPKCKQEWLDAYDLYLRHFGDTELATRVRYRRASIYQDYHRFDEAVAGFEDLLRRTPDDELAPYAADRLLESLTAAGRADEARRWAVSLRQMPNAMAEYDVRARVAKILGEAAPPRPPRPKRPGRVPDVIPGTPDDLPFRPDENAPLRVGGGEAARDANAAPGPPATPPRPRPEAEKDGTLAFIPRMKLFEVQYPQLVAVGAGGWALLRCERFFCPGAVGEFELGLGGPTLAVGLGAMRRATSYEDMGSFGAQAIVHRTWPWWSPRLPTNATFVGGEVFAAYFAFRCSAGLMWSPFRDAVSSPFLIGGCGLATP